MTIELGYAPLTLPDGQRLSVVDVPGHERFVRTMVAGATGVDLDLMTIAADDGVMPQTREHAAVLAALGVSDGVVAITKTDLHDPASATAGARELLPDADIVPCSARTGAGVADVAHALQRVAERLNPSARVDAPAVLHIDRAFTIRGAGTVVTGTLWSGSIARADALKLLPARRLVRVRGVHVHDTAAKRATAGQRVALNLAGIAVRDVSRGDALVDPASGIGPTLILDAALEIGEAHNGTRVQVHHGTRAAPGRLVALSERYWQLRLERPLLAAAGDRFVVRRIAPPDTLGGGVVLDPRARRHSRRPDLLGRLGHLEHGERPYTEADGGLRGLEVASAAVHRKSLPTVQQTGPSPGALALAERLRTAGHGPPASPPSGTTLSTWPPCARPDSSCVSDAICTHTQRRSPRYASASSRSSTRRTGSPSPGCGTSCRPHASSRSHCSSTSTPRGSPAACPDDRRVLRHR